MLLEGREHEDQAFSELDLAGADLADHVFEYCTFTRCNLSGARLTHARFVDCKFHHCDLSNADLVSARLRGAEFESCKILGAQWIRLQDFDNLSFADCNLSYGNFT